MFNSPSHGGFHRSYYIDHNHEMSYRGYNNLGYHASDRGTINIYPQRANYQYRHSSNPLEELWKYCSPTAAFNSAARFDPPRCAESTRCGIIRIIEEWINGDEEDASLFWLHGGAGVGKSALAQSLSERFRQKKELGATFFFFRGDPSRNHGVHLIPTLVSHLVGTLKEIIPFVEVSIREQWDLFMKTPQDQIQELLVKPLLALKVSGAEITHPRLIVIDGLDECENPDVQCELLRVIASAIHQIPYPLRFLVTSRPEAHITHVFHHNRDLQAIAVQQYNLSDDPDADMDIRKFLEEEFAEIHRVHRLGRHLPHAWPDQKAITSLVERSSGHFVYASTVIRFIRSPKHRPDDRLEIILRLRPPQQGDRPYGQLDALYAVIFAGVDTQLQLEKICLVLGFLYFQSQELGLFKMVRDYTIIEELLEMKAGDLILLLDPILSLVVIDGDEVRILHKSLFDYLLDITRGGHLPFDLLRVHQVVATYILERKILKDLCDIHSFQDFAHHCQYAYLNDKLQDYLHSLEVPFPKSVMTTSKTWDNDLNLFLGSITTLWYLFRTLSRGDFDSTGQVYEQYVTKWMSYLRTAVPTCTPPQNSVAITKADSLKRDLGTVLMSWKFPNLNPMNTRVDPIRRAAFIQREHTVFLAYSKVSFPDNTNAMALSLVSDDDFIHSYHFGVWDKRSFLILRTCSKKDNMFYQLRFNGIDDLVPKTLTYLTKFGNLLTSDHYQKYGVEPHSGTFNDFVTSDTTSNMVAFSHSQTL